MVELIVCEKPAQAEKIASALGKPTKHLIGKVPYYELEYKGRKILVGCAVGHLFNLAEKEKNGWKYPVWDIEWRESYKISKKADFSEKYLRVLEKIAKKSSEFTVACDKDMEGSLIGWNCIRFIAKQKDGKRMNFSTLTKDELIQSYEHASPHLDFNFINAGEARHVLDWLAGINLSRALTLAVKSAGLFKLLSIGRVQGPALKIIVDREEEITNFKPEPYWQIFLEGKAKEGNIQAEHEAGKIFEKDKADSILKKTKGKKAIVSSVEKKSSSVSPLPPFDLTTLQTEAYRYFGISPKETLSIAQDLYTAGLISYPRTSSQKLPVALGHESLLGKISKIKEYAGICQELLKRKLQPSEGKKVDPAHPAIFATGEQKKLEGRSKKIYDLIVRRFLACFSDPLEREIITAKIDVNNEIFVTKGMTIQKQGWHDIYFFMKLEEQELPPLQKGDEIKQQKIILHEDQTKPPKRYTEASLIKELERLVIGTKSTRAQIIDTLYQRNYIREKAIEATTLGIAAVQTLKKYCPEILDEKLTRHFEEEMDLIMEDKKKKEDVLEESKHFLFKTLEHFKKHEKKIGEGLVEAAKETRHEMSKVGPCPVCKSGELMIRSGKFGQFVACNKYPDCKTTFSVPSGSLIKTTDQLCKECGFMQVIAIRRGRRPWMYCLNKQCPAKIRWRELQAKKAAESGVVEEKPRAKRPGKKKKSVS
ncbi:MAG TPA: DNA topoisomerase I [Candidatus Nanoarchaeia archaeon]|nr:DNA topoisomerase I [Candidatus Nanoarchaeia archaeon]